jgi:DNA topoisomerase-3
VIAEKPSVARDLARALGVSPSGRSSFESDQYVITWCVGHLVELDEPASYDPAWKVWRLDTLPMLPSKFRLRASKSAPEQVRTVRALLRDSRQFREVINGCDAGREGELIFRYVYEFSGSTLPVRRLWVSSLTDEAIARGFSKLEPASRYNGLADAARCRSEADWLVGLNATRAVTARARSGSDRTLYSIGRVQTPTLALLVAREDEIVGFVPKDYWQLRGAFATARGQSFKALWSHGTGARLASESLSRALVARCEAAERAGDDRGPVVEAITTKRNREPPPQLFDLTSLQRTANKRYGFSAARTLELAQSLYERHKVLTYPRTDSRHLPRDAHAELPKAFAALAALPAYAPFVAQIATPAPMPKRMFDDAQVSDHHAIIPTGRAVTTSSLSPEEQRIFDLVARRFLAGFFGDAEFDDTTVVVRVGADTRGSSAVSVTPREAAQGSRAADKREEPAVLDALPPPPDRFVTRGRVRVSAGWQDVAGINDDADARPRTGAKPTAADAEARDEDDSPQQSLPKLTEGERLRATYEPLKKQTRPPPRFSEATLLAAMESAGRTMDDSELRAAMRDRGLGTPATRASIIETLIARTYVQRDRRNVVPTPLGSALVHALPIAALASAELTGEWEARLARIERGEDTREAFMRDIATFVRDAIDVVKSKPIVVSPPEAVASAQPVGRCPRCGSTVVDRTGDYACAVGPSPCGLSVPKKIAGRMISPELAGVLLRARKTVVLRGFQSRAGKRFAAALELRDDGTIHFAFESGARSSSEDAEPPRPAPSRRSRAALSAERDAATAPPAPRAKTEARASAPSSRAKTPEADERATLKSQSDRATVAALVCPRCATGTLVTGNRGWGCSRWKDGCSFVIWFETAGRKLTVGQLEQLVTKGKTRSSVFRPGNGPPVKGRLVLDVSTRDGCAHFEAADA